MKIPLFIFSLINPAIKGLSGLILPKEYITFKLESKLRDTWAYLWLSPKFITLENNVPVLENTK